MGITRALRHPDRIYVGNEWIRPASGEFEAVVDPSTEAVIAEAPVGSARDADQAIGAAREAFDSGPWPQLPAKARAVKLQQLHTALQARSKEIIALIMAEAGATATIAQMAQFEPPMDLLQITIDACTRPAAESLPIVLGGNPAGGTFLGAGVTIREPVGVVAAITPYNAPFFMNIAKIAPALAAGNTIVVKPSPFTPFEALLIADIADSVGFPRGVLNVVTGGAETGHLLTTDARVDMVTFTGSDTVGSQIMAQAAPGLKRILLELGGKSPLIVRADADIQEAAAAALAGFTFHCGQGCGLTTRIIVHNSIKAEFEQALAAAAGRIKLGEPNEPTAIMGPLIRESQRARVERYVDIGVRDGGRLLFGGRRPPALKKGYYYEPTVFSGLAGDSTLAQEEIFGPVAVVLGYDNDDEAVRIANGVKYGLAAMIYTKDLGKAYELATRIRAGYILLNGGPGPINFHAPFGGFKRSGIGREFGVHGLNSYTELKSVGFHAG